MQETALVESNAESQSTCLKILKATEQQKEEFSHHSTEYINSFELLQHCLYSNYM